MKKIFLFILVLLSYVSYSQVFHLDFDVISDSKCRDQISNSELFIHNQFNNPEQFASPFASSLRFDGHSTYIAQSGFDFSETVTTKMAFECWYATESFNQSIAGIFVHRKSNSGLSIKVRPFGKLLFQFYPDNKSYFIESNNPIPVYKWNHIVAQVDLENKNAQLYINGQLQGEKVINEHEVLSMAPSSEALRIGRDQNEPQTHGFITSTLNGALDEVRIYDDVFTPQQIQEKYEQINEYETDLYIDPMVRHPDDHLRPRYHFMPNTSWANESYGFTYYNDKYHLFFQKNPNAPTLNFMHWGHMSSPDLVSWKEERMPLRPQEGFSSVGTWSGTTFFDDQEKPVIAYTGVNGAYAGIGIAELMDQDLIEWELNGNNPVIESAPSSIPNQDFRDPYVWSEGKLYYMVIGSGKANSQGGILMSYKSEDYVNWELIDPIYQTTASVGGRFWEMPYFNKINEEDYILVVTPQFIGLPAKTIYWVGKFEDEKFYPYDDQPKDFELLSRNLLSPAIGRDEDGRQSYIGIIPEDRNAEDQIAAGWRQTFSIPRVIRLLADGETISHYPHPNLCRARRNLIELYDFDVQTGTNFNIPEYRGTQSELHFNLHTEDVDEFRIQVYKNANGSEFTSIVFDLKNGKLGIDRKNSSPYNTVEDYRFNDYNFNPNDSIDVRIFLDHSILEVFVDNLVVMSARVYPSQGSDQIDLVTGSEGEIEVVSFNAWDIVNKEESSEEEVCEPSFLPDDFFSYLFHVPLPFDFPWKVYPNPASDYVKITRENIDELTQNTEMNLLDQHGRKILHFVIEKESRIDLSPISSGQYFIKLFGQNYFHVQPLIIN